MTPLDVARDLVLATAWIEGLLLFEQGRRGAKIIRAGAVAAIVLLIILL